MPYIDAKTRAYIVAPLNAFCRMVAHRPVGVINYVITRLLTSWIGSKPHYARFNAAIGMLECTKLELYRRMVAPYEDVKRGENGDVYPSVPNGCTGAPCTCSPELTKPKGDTPHERE